MLHEWLVVHRKTETNYWWFVNKRRLVRQLLERYVPKRGVLLETGCGGGLFSSILHEDGWRVISADVAPAAAQFAHRQGVPEALAFDAGGGWPVADASLDTVVMLDMLEHVKDDARCLAEARRVVRPGGLAVVSVPAYAFLFSTWDEYNQHFRRYSGRTLSGVARDAGWRIERLTYWNAVSVPPAVILRLKDKFLRPKFEGLEFPPVPAAVNVALIAYGRAECAWLKRFNLPVGLSVLAVLRNPEKATP